MVVTLERDRAVVRARAPGPARTRRGRVPWTFLAVLAATVLATLGLLGMSSSASDSASAADEGGTRSMAVGLLSPSAASASPAGTQRPDPATGVSAPATSPDTDPNPAGGSDLDPSPDGKALVTLALLVLVLFGVGGGRRTADDSLSGADAGGVEHVPKADTLGQLCLDALAPGSPRIRPSSPPGLDRRRGGPAPIRYLDRAASCRAVFSRVRAQVGDEAGGRATTNADRETAYAGASPDDLPRAVSRSRSQMA
jgi:hypothetical protein